MPLVYVPVNRAKLRFLGVLLASSFRAFCLPCLPLALWLLFECLRIRPRLFFD